MIIGDTPAQLGQIEAAGAMMIDGKVVMQDDYRALKAQVNTLLDELNASAIAILARNPSDETHAIACSMAESAKANPQQILAEVKAQAVMDAVANLTPWKISGKMFHLVDELAQYADSIRRGEVKL